MKMDWKSIFRLENILAVVGLALMVLSMEMGMGDPVGDAIAVIALVCAVSAWLLNRKNTKRKGRR